MIFQSAAYGPRYSRLPLTGLLDRLWSSGIHNARNYGRCANNNDADAPLWVAVVVTFFDDPRRC